VESKGLLKVIQSHRDLHRKCGNTSETTLERDTVTTGH